MISWSNSVPVDSLYFFIGKVEHFCNLAGNKTGNILGISDNLLDRIL